MMAHVRFAARDPGGANVLAGFLSQCAADTPFRFDVWSMPRSTPVFTRVNLPTKEFSESFTPAELHTAWDELPANALVTGTTQRAAFEPALWDIARQRTCPSLAVNDSWMNLAGRFAVGRPDFVGAIDAEQADELVAIGFNREHVVVTGHPWLSPLRARCAEIARSTTQPATGSGVHVLFASEPIAKSVASGMNAPFGFDEFDAFTVLHSAACAAVESGTAVTLAVKFHPYEESDEFLARATALSRPPGLELLPIGHDQSATAWILWADLVAGISSMLLLEAMVFGKPVVSLQPGLTREETFIASRRGYADTLTDPTGATAVLHQLLEDSTARRQLCRRHQQFIEQIPTDSFTPLLHWICEHGHVPGH